VAGNVSAPLAFSLEYDATPPSVTASPSRGPDANGWYNHPVSVAFNGTDSVSGIDSCTAAVSYSGPDTAGTTLSGTCTDKAGNSASTSFSLQYDSTPPTVSASLARPPDANGWYNHPVALNASGTDAGSGIGSCTGGTYSGPDTNHASITATCVDNAGNSATQTVTFEYDATPPKLSDVKVTNANGSATLTWAGSPDITSVTVERAAGSPGGKAMVYKGDGHTCTMTKLKNGEHYRYVLSAVDAAGNVATATATALPLALTSPVPGQKVKRPPLLRWSKVTGADYYNVQLFFKGHKILTEWPAGTTLKVPRTWTFAGHRHKLGKGRYRWYVWPGHGSRKLGKYGQLVGSSYFVFA
jgi:hypothetical protein